MTKNEREKITEALLNLNAAWNTDEMEYDAQYVMAAHRILKSIDLTPRKSPSKGEK